jgi:hypothetical protein
LGEKACAGFVKNVSSKMSRSESFRVMFRRVGVRFGWKSWQRLPVQRNPTSQSAFEIGFVH